LIEFIGFIEFIELIELDEFGSGKKRQSAEGMAHSGKDEGGKVRSWEGGRV
jgi:hypothetical protein